jgi:DNA polymerase III subunit epsilon
MGTLVAVVDTESTGLGTDDEPISIGLILIEVDEKGGLVAERDRYYGVREPGVPIHPAARRVHGMTAAQLAGKAFDLQRVAAILSAAQVAVAHNASFDARMIAKVVQSASEWRCSLRQFPWVVESGRKLDHVCERLGVQRAEPHNAMTDCEALLRCLLHRTGKTERSRTYLGALLAREPYFVEAAAPRPIRVRQSPRQRGRQGNGAQFMFALGKGLGAVLRALFSSRRR